MALERDSEGRAVIRLDGSMGLGMLARLTIITSDKTNGTREETFEVPYTLIDFKVLQASLDASYVLGYRVERIVPADDQPIVFKLGEPSGDIR